MNVTKLPDASRENMLDAAGLDGSARWDGVARAEGSPDDPVTTEFMNDGGWGIVTPGNENRDSGLVAHRGVLTDGEYVDFFVLRDAVEAELGFTYAEVSAAYRIGRPTAEQRQLRARIDARLLALSRSGGNMDALGRVLNIGEATIDRALARARLQERA
jgi:hypothetical protein